MRADIDMVVADEEARNALEDERTRSSDVWRAR